MEKILDSLFGGFKWYRQCTKVSWSKITPYGDARTAYGSWWVRGEKETTIGFLVMEKEWVAAFAET